MNFDILAPVLALLACSWLIWHQLAPRRKARRMQGKRVDLPDSPPGEPRLYYFWSPHCGPCRSMTRLVDRLQLSQSNLIKINAMEQADIARDLGVAATPSWVLVRDGRIEKMLLGAQSEQRILELLNIHDQL